MEKHTELVKCNSNVLLYSVNSKDKCTDPRDEGSKQSLVNHCYPSSSRLKLPMNSPVLQSLLFEDGFRFIDDLTTRGQGVLSAFRSAPKGRCTLFGIPLFSDFFVSFSSDFGTSKDAKCFVPHQLFAVWLPFSRLLSFNMPRPSFISAPLHSNPKYHCLVEVHRRKGLCRRPPSFAFIIVRTTKTSKVWPVVCWRGVGR